MFVYVQSDAGPDDINNCVCICNCAGRTRSHNACQLMHDACALRTHMRYTPVALSTKRGVRVRGVYPSACACVQTCCISMSSHLSFSQCAAAERNERVRTLKSVRTRTTRRFIIRIHVFARRAIAHARICTHTDATRARTCAYYLCRSRSRAWLFYNKLQL